MKYIVLFVLCLASMGRAVEITVSGYFDNCTDNEGDVVSCIFENNQTSVKWATPIVGQNRSGLEFVEQSNSSIFINIEEKKTIGSLIHHNWPVTGNVPDFVDFIVDLEITIPLMRTEQNVSIPFRLSIDETTNRAITLEGNETCPYASNDEWFGLYNDSMPCCPYYTPTYPCSDRIKFVTPFNKNHTFTVNETQYTLKIEGFVHLPNTPQNIVDSFVTQEKLDTEGVIYASLVAVCSNNSTCDDQNKCTLDECVDGFCMYNKTALNFVPCNYTQDIPRSERSSPLFLNTICYEDYCLNGECMRIYENCSESTSSTSSSNTNEGGDGDDIDLLPLWISLSALACLAMCLPLLCIPPLLGLLALTFLKSVSLPSTVSVRGADPTELEPMGSNPIYESLAQEHTNPTFEV